ncbi:hypothetical protein NHX12_023472 [Muraenolepis orangiensis]|uniref:C3H1-type domain-containing protein n=1 Tax=Muraenolepis orangiensis TaxID=630683 RepID=A0A9Q0EKI6_9TELE|nr:hypothetical protein NHX12_023472 [Muraenolepis orangiensis]
MDFFRKLGYSAAQVRSVMQKFGHDTDRVLGELVRTGASPQGHGEAPGSTTTTSTGTTTTTGTGTTTTGGGGVSELGSRGGSGRESGGCSPESQEEAGDREALRPIVIDGSNVAMSHGNKEVFSCQGIQLAVDFFLERGHSDIIVFVPSWRKEPSRPDVPISDQHILRDLERRKIVVFTPSRRVAGKRVVCYDDRFIVKLAHESSGVILSNDTYRDLQGENPEWRRFIEENLLMYFFVNNRFIVPDDPLGRHGPTLDNFLRKVPKMAKKHPCPYGRKCTYGIKCKFHHPERGPQSSLALADELREKVKAPSSHRRPASPSSGGSGTFGSSSQSLSLEELAQNLSLHQHQHQQGSSAPSRKGPVSVNVLVKGGAHGSKRHPSRKEKATQPSSGDRESPPRSTGSQVQLDSGLGSIENQTVSGEHGCHSYGECYGPPSHPPLSQGPQYYPASHRSMGQPAGGLNPDAGSYDPARYLGYAPPPVYLMSVHGHSHPTDLQNRRPFQPVEAPYWSDPYAGVSPAVLYAPPGERPAPWGYLPPQPPPPAPAPASPAARGVGARETARKKLLAIFNSRLVDRAMELHPGVMDPQVLVAEIVMLQSQERAGR